MSAFSQTLNGWPVVVGRMPWSEIDPAIRLDRAHATYLCGRCGIEKQTVKGRNTRLCQDCRSFVRRHKEVGWQ